MVYEDIRSCSISVSGPRSAVPLNDVLMKGISASLHISDHHTPWTYTEAFSRELSIQHNTPPALKRPDGE